MTNSGENKIDGARVWTIKGDLYDENGRPGATLRVIARCDGPVPEINEQVEVIEKSYATKLEEKLEIAIEALNFYSGKELYEQEWDRKAHETYLEQISDVASSALEKLKGEE